MNTYRKLLSIVATGQDQDAALIQSVNLARQCEAELRLLSYDEPESPVSDSQAWLDATLDRLTQAGIRVSGRRLDGSPEQDAMLAEVRLQNPDLAIKQLRRESGLRRLFFTPADWHLASHSPCPFWLVGEDFITPPRHALAAVDIGGNTTDDALNHYVIVEARRLARTFAADLHLAHVCEPVIDVPEDAALQVLGTPPTMALDIHKLHEERFARIADDHDVPASQRHLGFGRIDQVLEELGEQLDAELIVAGSHDRSRLQRFLIGSVSADLISHARHSILVVSTVAVDTARETASSRS